MRFVRFHQRLLVSSSLRPRAIVARSSAILALATVSGCHVAVTQTIAALPGNRETIAFQERFDNAAYSRVEQLGGSVALGLQAARADGWAVTQTDAPGIHSLSITKTTASTDASAALTKLDADANAEAAQNDAFLLGPTAFVGMPLTLAGAGVPIASSVPALLQPAHFRTETKQVDSALARANARTNAEAVNAIVSVTIVLNDSSGMRRIALDFARQTADGNNLHAGAAWPTTGILATWQAIGDYGVFDYERASPPLCSVNPKYHRSRMFGAGVYAQGAGMPQQLMDNSYTLAEDCLAQHPVRCP